MRRAIVKCFFFFQLAMISASPLFRYIFSTKEFDRLLKQHAEVTGLPLVVSFSSESCADPCSMMAPIFKQIATEFKDQAVFVKIDASQQFELSSRYQVQRLPTFSYFLDGSKIDDAVGAIGEVALRDQMLNLLRHSELQLNTKLELSALVEFYKAHNATKSESDAQKIHEKCVGMNHKGGITHCVGAPANQLIRKLNKKYGKTPRIVKRFSKMATTDGSPATGIWFGPILVIGAVPSWLRAYLPGLFDLNAGEPPKWTTVVLVLNHLLVWLCKTVFNTIVLLSGYYFVAYVWKGIRWPERNIPPGFDPLMVKRLRREKKVRKWLGHPMIIEEKDLSLAGTGSKAIATSFCAICLCSYEVGDEVVLSRNLRKERCSHVFHMECMVEWFAHQDDDKTFTCPCCRQDFVDKKIIRASR